MEQKLPFSFPLSSSDILKRRSSILIQLMANDDGFCRIPVSGIQESTLTLMLKLYDRTFLSGCLSSAYKRITVSLSSRLISSAGKFIYARSPSKRMEHAEIRMSSDFLFRLNHGPFFLNGLQFSTPQEAFLLVFEHEICHALETALFGSTGHSRQFLALANGLFGHTDVKHSLPTRKYEADQNGLSVGSCVSFSYEGKQVSGLLSYMGKTATVMVPDRHGAYRDSSGKRYTKYRVPPSLLKKD